MKAVIAASCLAAICIADEIKSLRKQCYPCLAFDYRYCADDDNLVNLEGNKCFEKGDKEKFCKDFIFIQNSILCEEEELKESKACDRF